MERLDFEGRKAFVREVDCDYYTDAITYTKVTILDTFADGRSRLTGRLAASHGEVHVVSRVVGFKKIKFYTNENVGSGELDLPEQQMHTTSYWLTIPRPVMAALPYATDDRRDGVVGPGVRDAAGRAAAADVRPARHRHLDRQRRADDETGRSAAATACRRAVGDEPRIFVYDNYPGGIGFSAPLFGMHDELLRRTRELIAGCECEHGCPTCVGPIGDTGPLAKTVALRMLAALGTGVAARRRRGDRGRPGGGAARRRPERCPPSRGDGGGRAVLMSLKPSLAERLRAVVGTAAVPRVHPDAGGSVWEAGMPERARDEPCRPGPPGGGRARRPRGSRRADGACIVVDRHYAADDRHGRQRVGDIVGQLREAATGWACSRAPGRRRAGSIDGGVRVRDGRRGLALCSWTSRRRAWPAAPARRRSSSAARGSTARASRSASS